MLVLEIWHHLWHHAFKIQLKLKEKFSPIQMFFCLASFNIQTSPLLAKNWISESSEKALATDHRQFVIESEKILLARASFLIYELRDVTNICTVTILGTDKWIICRLRCFLELTGAIIRDEDRRRAPFVVLGLSLGNAWIIEEIGLETCWRDRHNLVEIYDVTKMLFSRVGHYSFFSVQKRCKSNCPEVLASSLLKPMPPYTLSLRTSARCLPVHWVSRT